jgi:hypothetical protein
MSNGETKQRTSVRVSQQTLDDLESYRVENDIDNRSAAFEHMVEHHNSVKQSVRRWETVAEHSLFAVTFSLLVAAISTVSFVVAYVQAGYPSPWTLVSFSVLVGAILAALGGGVVNSYTQSKVNTAAADSGVNA